MASLDLPPKMEKKVKTHIFIIDDAELFLSVSMSVGCHEYSFFQLFRGHVLPKVRLDDLFLRQYPDADYVSLSALNTTFSLRRVETGESLSS